MAPKNSAAVTAINAEDLKQTFTPYMIALFSGDKVFVEWKESSKYNGLKQHVDIGSKQLLTNAENPGDYSVKLSMTLDTFATKIAAKGLVIATPVLPPRSVMFSVDKDGGKHLYSFHPRCKQTVTYGSSSYPDVSLPSIIFEHILKTDYKYAYSRMYMVKESNIYEIDKDTQLYRVPFPNVYSDSKICWGSNPFFDTVYQQKERSKTWDNLHWMSNLYETFFNSPFNNDLYDNSFGLIVINAIGEMLNKNSSGSVIDLFKSLQSIEYFPDEVFKVLDNTDNSRYKKGKLGEA